jgi:arylsulfatase A-like enzyme
MIGNSSRRIFLKAAGAVGAAASLIPPAAGAISFQLSSPKKPNVVYLFSDEHRYQSMSFTETPQVQTPAMAQMAAGGTFFKNAVSCNPVCVPYRSMLLTGRWCYSTGMLENNGTLAPWEKTIGHVFKDAGYNTGYTGKWHAGDYPQLAGFDWHMNWGGTDQHWDSNWTDLHGTGQTYSCTNYNAITMSDQALDFINANAGKTNPFFLMVSWNPPHAVFTDAPPDKIALYPGTNVLPWRANVSLIGTWWASYQGYHAHITAIDEQLGRVFARLEELGIASNTIVVYSSDHGSMMKSQGTTNKRRPEEESCRIPFIIKGQGIPAGIVREELFSSIDIFPTLCGLAGVSVPGTVHGEDFSSLVRGHSGPDPSSQFLMHVAVKGITNNLGTYHTPFFRGVRGPRFTYTVGINGSWQLFDNVADPLQKTNLISNPAYADARSVQQAELDRWIEQVENPYMHTDYHTMPLTNRIARQALLHGKGVRLYQFLSQLKLSPAQEDQLKPIELQFYGTDGRPLAGYTWPAADAAYRAGVKVILTPEQVAKFEELEALEQSALG